MPLFSAQVAFRYHDDVADRHFPAADRCRSQNAAEVSARKEAKNRGLIKSCRAGRLRFVVAEVFKDGAQVARIPIAAAPARIAPGPRPGTPRSSSATTSGSSA